MRATGNTTRDDGNTTGVSGISGTLRWLAQNLRAAL